MASFDNEHTRGLSIALAAATVAWFFQPQAIASVPQILGLVATAEPTELKCDDGICSAAFSSFCLQANKPSPLSGTEYRVADGSDIALIYTDAEGVTHKVDATPYVDIDSERRYAAVRISLPENALEAFGTASIALRIGDNASAVPAAIADDRSPITMAEIGKVTGSLRRLAGGLFDPGSDTAVAAAAALKLVNASMYVHADTTVDVEALWRVHDDNITRANVRVWDGLEAARS